MSLTDNKRGGKEEKTQKEEWLSPLQMQMLSNFATTPEMIIA